MLDENGLAIGRLSRLLVSALDRGSARRRFGSDVQFVPVA